MNQNVKGLIGALVTGAAGIATGYVAGAINNPKPPVYREPEPICGCGHHFSFHDTTGCNYVANGKALASRTEPEIETKTDKDTGLKKTKTLIPASESYQLVKHECGCKRYAGPETSVTYASQQ